MDEKDYITIEEFEKLYENIDTSKITIEKMKETEKLIVEGPISIVYQLLKGNNFIEEIMIDKNINDPLRCCRRLRALVQTGQNQVHLPQPRIRPPLHYVPHPWYRNGSR